MSILKIEVYINGEKILDEFGNTLIFFNKREAEIFIYRKLHNCSENVASENAMTLFYHRDINISEDSNKPFNIFISPTDEIVIPRLQPSENSEVSCSTCKFKEFGYGPGIICGLNQNLNTNIPIEVKCQYWRE